jgi:hypothetical protein
LNSELSLARQALYLSRFFKAVKVQRLPTYRSSLLGESSLLTFPG